MEKQQVKYKDRILPGSIRTRCRSCGAPIIFVKIDTGKNMPINADGVPHWGTCDDPNKFRKKR
jgi:hypothetical protein